MDCLPRSSPACVLRTGDLIGSGWYVHKQASADLLLRSFPTLCVYVYKERNQLCWLIKKRSCLLDWYYIHVLLPIQPGEREHTGPDLFASAGHVQKETRSSDWLRTPIGDWSFCCCTDRCSAAAVTYSLIGRFLHSSGFLKNFVPRCDI